MSRKYHSKLEAVPLVLCNLQFRDSTVIFKDYFFPVSLANLGKNTSSVKTIVDFWPCERNLNSTLPKSSVYSDKVSTWPNGTQAGDHGNDGSSLISPEKNFPLGMGCSTFFKHQQNGVKLRCYIKWKLKLCSVGIHFLFMSYPESLPKPFNCFCLFAWYLFLRQRLAV